VAGGERPADGVGRFAMNQAASSDTALVDAATAVFLLILAQGLHVWFQYDWHVAGRVIFVDRVVYAGSLAAYAGWLTVKSHAPAWVMNSLGIAAVIAIGAIPLDRAMAMPMIWILQVTILIGLAAWLVQSVGDRWAAGFLALATGAHALGALTYFPLCQLAVPAGWVASPGGVYVCNAVFGPLWGSGVFFGGVAVLWAAGLVAAVRYGRA
jgi:hypothetical protein